MSRAYRILTCVVLLNFAVSAATKPHVIALGRWTSVLMPEPNNEGKSLKLKIRQLYIDGRPKEFTTGVSHDITDRTFAVQRIYRINDSLPQQPGPTQWQWQRGGWLLVDRVTGKVQQITLAEFDPDSSVVNWFRDYAAYCGVSDDGQKLFGIIMQIGRRKPLLKKAFADATDSQICVPAIWERNPLRVTFECKPGQKLTFNLKNRAIDEAFPEGTEGDD
jgi:hypothetical protein